MKKTFFQIGLFLGIGLSIILAVMVFAGVIPVPGKKNAEAGLSGTVTIWGTIPETQMLSVLDPIQKSIKNYTVDYREKDKDTYEQDLVEALASGKGPDMVILDPGLLIKQSDKLYVTTFKDFPERDFKNLFADSANLYLSADGVLAVPISIDPIVLYYNKDILTAASIVEPPKYWNDLSLLTKTLASVDQNGTVQKSMVALGEYDNVTHAKDIVSMLALQLGNQIVSPELKYDNDKKPYFTYKVTFGDKNKDGIDVGESVLRYYTQFSDPSKETYNWNKSFQNDKEAFLSGKLAFYIGYASEYEDIKAKNPNLNFDISTVPQIKDSQIVRTYGKVLGIGVLKSSKNPNAAFNTSSYFSNPEFANVISSILKTAPARRDLLSKKQEDAYNGVVYPSAIMAASWYDPNPQKTEGLFKRMIQSTVSGRTTVYESVKDFSNDLQDMLP